MTDMDKDMERKQLIDGGESQKRAVKLTEKAFAEKIDKLQTSRKSKLNKAGNIRNEINGFMSNDDKEKVLNALDELKIVCDDAKAAHDALLGLMPHHEVERHKIWFKAKMLVNNDCVSNVNDWLSAHEINTKGIGIDDEVKPCDGVSNASSKYSLGSSKSTTSSIAKLKAAAERAAVLARLKVLKEKHA